MSREIALTIPDGVCVECGGQLTNETTPPYFAVYLKHLERRKGNHRWPICSNCLDHVEMCIGCCFPLYSEEGLRCRLSGTDLMTSIHFEEQDTDGGRSGGLVCLLCQQEGFNPSTMKFPFE